MNNVKQKCKNNTERKQKTCTELDRDKTNWEKKNRNKKCQHEDYAE